MGLFRFISVKLSLGLIVGILLGYNLQPSIPFTILLTGLGLFILGILFVLKKQTNFPLFEIVSILLVIFIGLLTFTLSQPENHSDHYSLVSKNDNSIWQLKIREVLKPNSFSDRYVAIIQEIDGKKASGKIIINAPAGTELNPFKVDDELILLTQPRAIKPPLNPHQFDYKNYLRNLGITDQVNLSSTNYFRLASHPNTFFGTAAGLRDKIITKLSRSNFGEAQLGIIQALLLGQRNDILKETYDDYKDAGAVHILAVSGLHIGIIRECKLNSV